MIENIFILKNGLPIYTGSLIKREKQNAAFEGEENITMMSGFFSALNSFANTVGNFGDMKEIKLNKVKFSFFIPNEARNANLLFVSQSNAKTSEQAIESLLNRISSKFLRKYPSVLKKEWNGRAEIFESFTEDIEEIISKSIKSKMQDIYNHNSQNSDYLNTFSKIIPKKMIDSNQNIEDFLSGDLAIKIFKKIDGYSSIEQIAEKIEISKEKIWLFCKSFAKRGLVSF
ncbi:MAG: hypothetical protein ACTSO2_18555 [Promethearchaeota archaeon]